MSEKDFAISTVATMPTVGGLNKKPIYLVTLLEATGKKNSFERFISIDKPESLNGFITVKGFFSELSEDEIIKSFNDLLTKTPKELILDVWFPWHRVCSVRSLVFNANKAQTLIK